MLLYNYQKLSKDQVTALAWYNWGGNDTHCAKIYPIITLTLDFTLVDPELQREKEKQQYCIRAEMIFQMIKNIVHEKYFELYMVESYCFMFTDNSTGD